VLINATYFDWTSFLGGKNDKNFFKKAIITGGHNKNVQVPLLPN